MKIKENSIIEPLPNNEVINSLEEYCEVEFPEEYKSFLKKYNGAVPETNTFTYQESDYIIERFLCLLDKPIRDQENGQYDIEVVFSQLDARLIEDEDLTGPNVIPIAALFAGDFLCLDYRTSEKPFIAIWLHEESEDFQPALIRIADSFNDFLEMLE